MNFQQAVTAVLTNYAGFSGRARRAEYWYFVLFNFALAIVANIIGMVLHTGILSMLVTLALFVPGLAVSIRRLHDTNRSGWFVLVALVPLIGALVLIYFLAQEGQSGPNQYGPDPKSNGMQAGSFTA